MTAVAKTATDGKSKRLAGQDKRKFTKRGILKKRNSETLSAAKESATATASMSAALEKRAANKQKLMAKKLVASVFRGEDMPDLLSPSERKAAKRRPSAAIPKDDESPETKARKLSPHKSKITGRQDNQQSPSRKATRSSPPQEPGPRPYRSQPDRRAKKMVRFNDNPATSRIEYSPIISSFDDLAVVVPGRPTATNLIGEQLFDLTCQSIALLLKWEQQFEALKEQNPDLGFKAAPFKLPKHLHSMYDLLYVILGVMKEPQQIHATRKLGKWPPRTERQQIAVLKKLVDESIDRELTNASNQMKSVLGGPNPLRCRAAIKIQTTLGKIWGLQNHMEVLMQDMLDEDSWRLEFNAFVNEVGVMPEEARNLLRTLVPVPPAATSPVSPFKSPRHWHFREPGTRQYVPRSGRIPSAPKFD